MDTVRLTGPAAVQLGVSGSGPPVYLPVYTPHVDEARQYFQNLSYGSRLIPLGSAEHFAFDCRLVQLGPLTVGEISYGADVRLEDPEIDSSFHVLAQVSGVMRSRQVQREVTVGPDVAGVYGPVGDIRMDWIGDCRMLSLRADKDALEHEMAAATGRPPAAGVPASLDLTGEPGRSLVALVRVFYDELRKPHSIIHQPYMAERWWRLVLSSLAVSLTAPADAGPHARSCAVNPRRIREVIDAIHADPGRPFTITDLASIAGVSVPVLQEAFRRHAGMSPMAYLGELRLSRAHRELTGPGRPSLNPGHPRWGITHPGSFARAYQERYGPAPPSDAPDSHGVALTPRQWQIAGLIAQGLTNKQIADELLISLRTAESHVKAILVRLGFTRRAQVAAWHARLHPDPATQ
jgi:DNA-binding CsgD family transcriptional regulator